MGVGQIETRLTGIDHGFVLKQRVLYIFKMTVTKTRVLLTRTLGIISVTFSVAE